jgi:hypothetical protein
MPRATVNPSESTRFDLKTCPGGFVVLRRLPYGKYLDRQTEAMEIKARAQRGEDMSMELKMMGRKTTVIEFRECILEHNLTDENEQPLNMHDPNVLDRLDGRIGQEIEDKLREMNVFEADMGKSVTTSSESSTTSAPSEETQPSS